MAGGTVTFDVVLEALTLLTVDLEDITGNGERLALYEKRNKIRTICINYAYIYFPKAKVERKIFPSFVDTSRDEKAYYKKRENCGE